MAKFSEEQTHFGTGSLWFRCILLFVIFLSITGCRGCQTAPLSKGEKVKRDDAVKPPIKPRLELSTLKALPTSGQEGLFMKPNNWYELQQSARANDSDETLLTSCASITRTFPFRPISILGLLEPISFDRKISLAHGQRKQLALEMFYPKMSVVMGDVDSLNKASIRVSYLPRTIGPAVREESYPVTSMPDYQYNFVVLSQNPARYQFISGLSSVAWPSEAKMQDERIVPFRVVQIAQADAQYNLPNQLTTWTSISHLMWNDCDETALTDKQKISLVDWLHFGGQLIINGPESQSAMKDSFLAKYLPLKDVKSGPWSESSWQEFNRFWSIASWGEKEIDPIRIPSTGTPPSIRGELVSSARWLKGCEGLVAERYIGSGRIVMTTFPIGESMLIRWPSFSSFFNAALLHRPPRVWQKPAGENPFDLVFSDGLNGSERDPTYVSRVRLLSRDLGRPLSVWKSEDQNGLSKTFEPSETFATETSQIAKSPDKERSIENQGLAQIENDAVFSLAATDSLKQASKIQVPRLKTILQLLGGYFFVLIPLNWTVFRLLGRIEFAWLAAPIIAMVGAIFVARSIQLDVGFSRSQSTLSLLDMKSGYSRGHLTSYLALYTSLSTNYAARHPSNEGIVLPVMTSSQRTEIKTDENALHYDYAAEKGAGLTSFPVRSNSTCFLRSEEMFELDGTIEIAWDKISDSEVQFKNHSTVTLSDCGIVAVTIDGQWKQAWIGELERESARQVQFDKSELATDDVQTTSGRKFEVFDAWKKRDKPPLSASKLSKSTSESLSEGSIFVGNTLVQIVSKHRFARGEAMLLGWASEPMGTIVVTPDTVQREEKTLVVIRLDVVDESPLLPDANLPSKQFREESKSDSQLELEMLSP